MGSTPSLQQGLSASRLQPFFRTFVGSKWTFIGLQVLDLSTTLLAFHYGGFEANPLVSGLTRHFGQLRGVLASKVIAILIALRVKRLGWVINVFYAAIVFWNILVLLGLSAKPH